MESFDVVIVGAGLFGLTVARTYTALHPEAKIAILESSSSIGGVWALDRLYPTLKTNNFVGTYELSDFPMDESLGAKPDSHISGEVAHLYLDKFAETFDLKRLIRFNTLVQSVECKCDDGWLLTLSKEKSTSCQAFARKLILATGVTSEAQMPIVPGIGSFGGHVLHAKDILRYHSDLQKSSKIVVVGGSKSAWDAAYLYASLGIKVEMLIRRNGRGPAWMAPPRVTPWKYPLEKLVHTRAMTLFSPCSWGEADGYGAARWFLHGTAIGRMIVLCFWWLLCTEVSLMNGYRKHPATKKLEPWANTFWTGAGGRGLLNYSHDFFQFVRTGQIAVRYGEVQKAAFMKLQLDDGTELPTDAVIFCTGWKCTPPMKFLPEGVEANLGFPGVHKISNFEEQLYRQVDSQISERFPCLLNPPSAVTATRTKGTSEKAKPISRPFQLYRSMIPPAMAQYRNFAFAGMLTSISTPLIAQAQSLWLVAFLDGSLSLSHCLSRHFDGRPPPLKTEAELLTWDTMYHSQFIKRRYPLGSGANHTDFVFDALPYLDLVLGDLGLRTRRKASVLRELFAAYSPKDYCGLIEEWISKKEVERSKGRDQDPARNIT